MQRQSAKDYQTNTKAQSAAKEKLAGHGGAVHAAACDVGDSASLEDYMNDAHAALGRLDVLVNNPSGFGRTDDDEGWKRSIDIDLMPVVRGSHIAIPMIEQVGGGAIIHISTISALTESMRTPPYGAIKAAVNHYTVTQAKSLAPKGIRVNAICPGYIATPLSTNTVGRPDSLIEGRIEGMEHQQPIPRVGRPDDIAEMALYLASDRSSFITAQALVVDGGATTGVFWQDQKEVYKTYYPIKVYNPDRG